MAKFETIGGQVTRGETFTKMISQIDELRDTVITMSHLHAGDDNLDRTLAKGWLGIDELLQRFRAQVIALAMNKLQ